MGKPKMYGINKPPDQKGNQRAAFPWPRKKHITTITPKDFVASARKRGDNA